MRINSAEISQGVYLFIRVKKVLIPSMSHGTRWLDTRYK
jgi:hypothetical protein